MRAFAFLALSAFPAYAQELRPFAGVCGLTEMKIAEFLGDRFAMVPLEEPNAAGFQPFLAQSIKGAAIIFLVPDGSYCVLWDNTDTGAAS